MVPQLHFRSATESDIPAMSAIRLSVLENQLSDPARVTLAHYHDYLERYGRGWVCEQGGRIVGFSYADKRDASIWALFVEPTMEGRGIGKGLLALAVKYLFGLGHATLLLSTGADTRADAFYTAQGWARIILPGNQVRFCLSR